MSREEFEKTINHFIERAEKDKDPYSVIHFSREQDVYTGYDSGLDFGDALMIVSGLCKKFEITPEAIPDMDILKPVNNIL